MKIKINRKKRGTHRTRHARQCKRNKNRRTRSQRGGVSRAEVFDEVIGEFTSCTKDEVRLTITSRFGSCEIFNKLLKLRNPLGLKTGVCDPVITNEQIRMHEYLFTVQPDVKALLLQKIETKWPEFVVHLKTVVEARYQKQNDADMARRMLDLKFPTSEAAKEAKAAAAAAPARPSSVAPARPSSAAAAAARPSSTAAARPVSAAAADMRPEAPPGYYHVGNIWQNEKGHHYPEEFFKPRAPLTGQALIDALNALRDD
jgi:hypothetical protein